MAGVRYSGPRIVGRTRSPGGGVPDPGHPVSTLDVGTFFSSLFLCIKRRGARLGRKPDVSIIRGVT